MFFTKKQTQLEKMIDDSGIDTVAGQLTLLVNKKIPTLRIAHQFVLEELDAARQGNATAQRFVKESGFKEHEYVDAMNNSFDEVDGENGPQQFLNTLLISQLQHNMDLMISLKLKIVDHLMRHWQLGRYDLTETNESFDTFEFDNSANILQAPKGQSPLIAVMMALEMMLKQQMWYVQKIDYKHQHPKEIFFSIIAQGYLKFNGPDIHKAKAIEASECTLGIIENDLDVLPTVLLQMSFNFYAQDIEAQLQMFDSRPNGGYSAIRSLALLVEFNRDDLLESFADVNPDSELETLLREMPLFESTQLFSQTFHGGPGEFAQHLPEIMERVKQIALHTIINL
ncbi:hypothetical protein [Sulfuricurvum sp.]|uniref:hypothetical protein n=1 Tax=Sulfuricurvum sp. TaxID=2025608 RepID=UPI002629C7F6|nr:hypothetical protein [Sulfuricurvum sp.]MDD3594862.1 hypothetical protein [Sulfuricurvum sp.]